jgi:hypothetical protein
MARREVLSPLKNQTQFETGHLPAPTTFVKNMWSFAFIPLINLHVVVPDTGANMLPYYLLPSMQQTHFSPYLTTGS